jgi:hypothetical protein
MITTFQALAVAVIALLPGASYTYAYERVVGGFGVTLADRLVRFLAASAVFQALLSWPTLVAYRSYVRSGRMERGDIGGWLLEVVSLGYVLLPTLVGTLIGSAYRRRVRLVRLLVGDSPEPRAWDYLWHSGVSGAVRIKLKSGRWLAGLYGRLSDTGLRSYAAGYPSDGDLYLSAQLQIDPDTGSFVPDNEGDLQIVAGRSGLLVRWAEVEYLDFMEIPEASG